MKRLRTSIAALLLLVLSVPLASAAITQVNSKAGKYTRTTITATNTTNSQGDNCIGVTGYVYKTIIADEVSGTAVWNIDVSNSFKANYATVLSGEAADGYDAFTDAWTNVCVHVTTCTTCVLRVDIYAQNP